MKSRSKPSVRWSASAIFKIEGRKITQTNGRKALAHNPMRFETRTDALAVLGFTKFHDRAVPMVGNAKLSKRRNSDTLIISMDAEALEHINQ